MSMVESVNEAIEAGFAMLRRMSDMMSYRIEPMSMRQVHAAMQRLRKPGGRRRTHRRRRHREWVRIRLRHGFKGEAKVLAAMTFGGAEA